MDSPVSDSLEKLRQQFDKAPFPRIPLDKTPRQNYNLLFKHNLVTPYYLKYQTVIDTTDALILDAGCGSGFNALILAEANPGAKIVGIDLSSASIELADQRLKFHGFDNAEFHTMLIEELPQLGMQFDYINCDETLYLLPDPLLGLQVMRSVLKPNGILRINVHSASQRRGFYRGQALCKALGLMELSPSDVAIRGVVETMQALRDDVRLKMRAWKSSWADPYNDGQILANYLLAGDKGFSIPDLFELLEATELDFLSMVEWRHWDATDLFKDPDNLPTIWAMSLEGASPMEKLCLYELLHPIHRLLDCWCTPTGAESTAIPVDEWDDADWRSARVQLHPQLRHDAAKQDLVKAIATAQSFAISHHLDLPTLAPVMLQSTLASCLLPLWDAPQSVMALAERHLQTNPRNPLTLEPLTLDDAFTDVKRLLNQLHAFLYVLPERVES